MRQQDKVLWTLQILGGGPFSICVRGNPTITHGGGTSVTHQILTESEVSMVSRTASIAGCKVKAWQMEGQSQEQKEERLTALTSNDRVWPCSVCPTCPWSEHQSDNPCGLEVWPPESVSTLKETSQIHLKAEEACPLRFSVN